MTTLSLKEKDMIVSLLNEALDNIAADDIIGATALIERSIHWIEALFSEDDVIRELDFREEYDDGE